MRDVKLLTEYAKKLARKAKEKILFQVGRSEVNTGGHGTQKYVIKKGPNKGKVAENKKFKG
jgi:hypothetical protein